MGRARWVVGQVEGGCAGLDDRQAGAGVAVPAEAPARGDRVLQHVEIGGSLGLDPGGPELGGVSGSTSVLALASMLVKRPRPIMVVVTPEGHLYPEADRALRDRLDRIRKAAGDDQLQGRQS